MAKRPQDKTDQYLDSLLNTERDILINRILGFLLIINAVAVPLVISRALSIGTAYIDYVVFAIFVVIAPTYFFRDYISLKTKVYILVCIMFSAGFAGMLSFGLSAGAELTLFFSIAVTFLFFGFKAGLITTILVAIGMLAISILFAEFNWRPDYDANTVLRSVSNTMPLIIIFPLMAVLLFGNLISTFNERLRESFRSRFDSEARFKRSLAATQDGIWEWQGHDDHFYWESQAEAMLGYERGELVDNDTTLGDFFDRIHPEDRAEIEELFLEQHDEKFSIDFECRLKTKANKYAWFQVRGESELSADGNVVSAIGSIRDIGDKKEIESQIKRQEHSYRTFVNNSSEGIWCISYNPPVDIVASQLEEILPKGIITEANEAAAKIFGMSSFEEIIGKMTPEMIFSSPKERQTSAALFAEFIQSGCQEAVSETVRINQDGSEQYIRYSLKGERHRGLLYNIWGVTSDVTVLRDTQAQLSHAQKMDAIGHLAGGIAHDFNNSLGGIMGAAELMSLKNEQAELKRYIEIILSATERARDLNSKLLTFSRKTKMTSTPIAVNPIVDDAIGLLRHSIDKRIELSADHVDSDSHIIGDPSEFHSALINLGINARDALPEGGEIIFRVKRITLDQYIRDSLNRELKPGDYISISVIDNGVGIPADLHESIFEPFFTTKDVGKGTGLGLAAVYGTIRQHRGGIQLTSVVGEGTTVELLVPAITVTEPVTEQSRQLQRMTNQDKTILIIDDEEMIRAMASSMLEELGYKTLIANSGVKALDLLSEQADQIDGILLDYTMPDHTGEEVFIEIKRHYPNLKVVMGSGFVGEQTMDRLQSYGLEYFLAKPYNMSQLKEIFDTALKGSIQQSKDQ